MMKYLTYKISPNTLGWLCGTKKIYLCPLTVHEWKNSNTSVTHGASTEHFGRVRVFAETIFATSPKPNFGHVNCSYDQTTVPSTRPVSGPR